MSNPKGLISPKEAKVLNNAYTARHELISKNITNKPDNRSSWFSLEEIEAFLEYAKAQAKKLGYEMDGIRIYDGAYPEDKDGEGYSTTFIVPTTSDSLGKDGAGFSSDIADADALNLGAEGKPPNANYPQ